MTVRLVALLPASRFAGGRSAPDPGLTRGPGPSLRSLVDSSRCSCEPVSSCKMRSLTCLDFDSDRPWLRA